jgi:hypothetical protein
MNKVMAILNIHNIALTIDPAAPNMVDPPAPIF